jgi:hypothetical protein
VQFDEARMLLLTESPRYKETSCFADITSMIGQEEAWKQTRDVGTRDGAVKVTYQLGSERDAEKKHRRSKNASKTDDGGNLTGIH